MKKYSWDINKLIEERNKIQNMYYQYEELLAIYDELIENYDVKISNSSTNKNDNYKDNFQHKVLDFKINIFDELQSEKLTLVKNGIGVSSKFESHLQLPTTSTLILSDEQLIKAAQKLFEEIPNPYFLEQFKYYTNPDNHLLHVRYHKKLSITDLGRAYTDPKNHISYGLISRYNSIQDVVSLSHELFHMIIRKKELPLFCHSNRGTYVEVEGSFANFLFTEKLKDAEYNGDELDNFEKLYLHFAIQNIIDTFIITSAFDRSDNNGNIDFKELRRYLKSHNVTPTIFKKNFLGFLRDDFENDLNYTISYLIALDLFEQYKTDPEKALNNLINLPFLTGEQPIHELENMGVTFFEDGYINLDKKCKQLLKEKTTSSKRK